MSEVHETVHMKSNIVVLHNTKIYGLLQYLNDDAGFSMFREIPSIPGL